MHRNRSKLWRGLLIGQSVAVVVAAISYRWAGRRLVESAYEGQSIELLNRVFAGRSTVPLSRYLIKADALASDLVGAAVLVILVQVALYFLGRRRATRPDGSNGHPHQHPSIDAVALTPLRKFAFTLVMVMIPVLFVAVPYGLRYAAYLDGLEVPPGLEAGTYQPPPMPGLTPQQLLQIGKAQNADRPPLRSYLNHPQEKPKGVTRIGIFGGSHAVGEEAAPEHDVSTHLARLLEEAGADVEVINFGVSGFGMSQTALLWDYLGSKYDLDYTIVMPFFFHLRQDNSFLYTSHHFGPLHGLHVVEGGVLRYIPIVGKDRLDSCRRYFSIIQPLRYWRYDTRVPMAFRPLLPSPYNRRRNPFYHRRDAEGATIEAYHHLFRKLAREAGQLIILTDGELHPKLIELQSDSIYVLASQLEEFREDGSCLYSAPHGHPSGIGYEVYARELAALLLGQEKPVYRILRPADELEVPEGGERLGEFDTLSTARDVTLSIAGAPIGEFRCRRTSDERWSRLAEEARFDAAGISSLAAYWKGDSPLFVPLTFPLRGGEEVAVEWTAHGEVRRQRLGRITGARGVVGKISIDWTGLAEATDPEVFFRASRDQEFGVLEMTSHGKVENVRVLIGSDTALIGEAAERGLRVILRRLRQMLLGPSWERTAFRPVVSEYIYVRGGEGQYVDTELLAAKMRTGDPERVEGSIDLSFKDGQEQVHSLPLMSYRLVAIEGAPFDPPFPAPVRPARSSEK